LHRNLTPGTQNKLLGHVMCRMLSGALLLVAASGLMAQDADQSSYQGPGVSSPGAGTIGTRSGEQLSLRYYLGLSGVVDSALVPFSIDSHGNLVRIPTLYGLEVEGGVYGQHSWKTSLLGLNYAGSYTRFFNYDGYNSNNHSLALGYTDQINRRLKLDLRESAGSLAYGTGQVANAASTDLNSSFTPATRVFDTRTYFLQSTVSATWQQSARMAYSIGGSAFLQNLKSLGLSNSFGYGFNGNMMRRMSKSATVGVSYEYLHFEFPGFGSLSNSHTFHLVYDTGLGRFWTLSFQGGATVTSGESRVTFALNPVLAALLNESTITGISNFKSTYPSGSIALVRRFQRASLGFNYFRGANSGTGFYTAGLLNNAFVSFSYTGIRKFNFGVNGGYYSLKSIGQSLGSYNQYLGGAGISYTLGRGIYASARYDYRHQRATVSNYSSSGSRITFGLNFSPGSLPLSLW